MAKPDVLVVDDAAGVAEDVARVIAAETGLRVLYASSAAEAMELVRQTDFKVVVLDQRMPTPGTALFQKVNEIIPDVHAIMLTGEASREEIGAAMDLGYKSYAPRGELGAKLGASVLHEYSLVVEKRAREGIVPSNRTIFSQRWPWSGLRRPAVTYRLSRIALLDSHYTPESEWRTEVQLLAGQKEVVTTTEVQEVAVVIDAETTTRLTSQLSASTKQLASIKSELKAEISERYKESLSTRTERSTTRQLEYQLEPAPANASEKHVTLRRIQYGPEYLRLRVRLTIDCQCCESDDVAVFDLLCKTGRIAVRREDRFSDDTVVVKHLGSG